MDEQRQDIHHRNKEQRQKAGQAHLQITSSEEKGKERLTYSAIKFTER